MTNTRLAIVSSVLAADTIPILATRVMARPMDDGSLIAGGIAPCA